MCLGLFVGRSRERREFQEHVVEGHCAQTAQHITYHITHDRRKHSHLFRFSSLHVCPVAHRFVADSFTAESVRTPREGHHNAEQEHHI